MRKTFVMPIAGAMVAAIMATSSADAASTRLTVSGRITKAGADAAVLLIADDGTSVRAAIGSSGKFTVKVPTRIASRFVTRKTGKGPSLHILKNGEYAGPVVLNVASTSKGWTRLTAKRSGTLSVGTLTMKSGYAIGKAKRTVIDTSRTIRLKKKIPVGARGLLDQMLMGPVRSFAALSRNAATLGADADRDGLPNLADPDMNGDGVLDAAQVAEGGKFEGLAGSDVLSNRPRSSIAFSKILEQESGIPVNSNMNPLVTEEQIGAYLAAAMTIEIGTSPADLAGTTVKIDCRRLSYCSPGSTAIIRGAPGESIDGKSLLSVQDSTGLITIPQRAGENTYLLRFYPGSASAAEGNLAGDTFEIVTIVNGFVSASEARVVTSSVATPMAVTSIGGVELPRDRIDGNGTFSSVADASKIAVSFYRPQAFAEGSTATLVDRGGLTYKVSIWPMDNSNTGYNCPVSSLSALSETMRQSSAGTPEPDQGLFDSDQAPAVNGTQLGFTLDSSACLAAQTSARHSLSTGQKWRIEIEGVDSDGNKVRVGTGFLVP
ncbi:MAG: hypothetical protein ACO3RB_01275 [Ilumatobacteraceae bacterium]